MSSTGTGSSWKICDRETSGEFTWKYGLCVVAPMNLTTPRSMCGSSTSCWALLKRWISSMNRMVVSPRKSRQVRAWSIFARISATLDSTPLSDSKREPVVRAITLASVVFPVPGGP